MNEEDKLLLEENGWTVECESPFEIRNDETSDSASGVAAQIVLDSLRPKRKKKSTKLVTDEKAIRKICNNIETVVGHYYTECPKCGFLHIEVSQ